MTNVTFDFSSQGVFVDQSFVYGITFNTTPGAAPVDAAGSLNIALSSSATDLSVGSDTTPHSIWLSDSEGPINVFPTCTTGLPTTGFQQVATNCGPWNPGETGAYGNEAVTDDIPAVQFNVVGGTVTGLYPGAPAQPIEYAITNPGTGTVHVSDVSAAVNTNGVTGDVETPGIVDVTGCSASWYYINGSSQAVNVDVPPGTTLFTLNSSVASALSIQMTNPSVSQDACEGASVGLTFSSN